MSKNSHIHYFEFHICDWCNMNCAGCQHFSNIVHERKFPSFEMIKRDLERMRELFMTVNIIRIMGGEPLLNPDLKKYVELCRGLFSESEIRVVTNGILIPNLSYDIFFSLCKTKTKIEISYYNNEQDIKEYATLLENAGVSYIINGRTKMFTKRYAEISSGQKEITYKSCLDKICHFLHNGELSACCYPQLIHYYNSEYGASYDWSTDCINIYEANGMEIIEHLSRPMQCCSYCREPQIFTWRRTKGKPSKSDWIISSE